MNKYVYQIYSIFQWQQNPNVIITLVKRTKNLVVTKKILKILPLIIATEYFATDFTDLRRFFSQIIRK